MLKSKAGWSRGCLLYLIVRWSHTCIFHRCIFLNTMFLSYYLLLSPTVHELWAGNSVKGDKLQKGLLLSPLSSLLAEPRQARTDGLLWPFGWCALLQEILPFIPAKKWINLIWFFHPAERAQLLYFQGCAGFFFFFNCKTYSTIEAIITCTCQSILTYYTVVMAFYLRGEGLKALHEMKGTQSPASIMHAISYLRREKWTETDYQYLISRRY